jgi:hypothetical protein
MTAKFVHYGKLRYRIERFNDGRSKFEIVKRGIQDITEIIGLNQFHDLDELDLSKNKISDITGLENLMNLKVLNLSYNAITDITGLENLTNLKVLNLSYNAITDSETLKKLKENHPYLIDIDLRGNPCFNPIEDIKTEVLKLNPSKTRILSVFSDWIDNKEPQFPEDALISEFVGEILKVEPEFFLQSLYNDIRRILEKYYGDEGRNLIEKNIIEKCCLYDGEQILYEYNGDISQMIPESAVKSEVHGRIYVTNYRIIAQGKLETSGGQNIYWGLAVYLLSGEAKRVKSKNAIIDGSAHQELPCYGYQFKIKNHTELKKKRNGIRYIVIVDNWGDKGNLSKYKQAKMLTKVARIIRITLQYPKKTLSMRVNTLYESFCKDVNHILSLIKEELEREYPSKYILVPFLRALRISKEYQQITDSVYLDIVRETYRLNPQFFMEFIYPKMKSWKFPSFINVKGEVIELIENLNKETE